MNLGEWIHDNTEMSVFFTIIALIAMGIVCERLVKIIKSFRQ